MRKIVYLERVWALAVVIANAVTPARTLLLRRNGWAWSKVIRKLKLRARGRVWRREVGGVVRIWLL